MELCGECMLGLCIVAIQNTKLVVIAMHVLPCYYIYLDNMFIHHILITKLILQCLCVCSILAIVCCYRYISDKVPIVCHCE